MILVTGATGQLGHAIAERLLGIRSADEIAVSVRDPEKARTFAERGVEVRQGDYGNPESLLRAFEGADEILMVSSNTTGEATLRNHRNAIDAAVAVGARRVVYTSHMGANSASLFPPMPGHAATEAMLAESGLAFTSLRNGFYADSGVMLMGNAMETGELIAPADGPVSWTSHADLVEAAVIALTEEGRLDGITPPLTGSEALDLTALAAISSDLTGRTIRRIVVDDEEFRAGLVARGVPADRVEIVMGLYAASRAGEFAAVDSTLERLLGRPPITMRTVLAERRPR